MTAAPASHRAETSRNWRAAGGSWLLIAVAASATGLAFRPALGDERLTAVVVASAGAATALVAVGVALGLRPAARTLVSVLAWIALAVVLWPDGSFPTTLVSLARGLATGATLLLDYAPPAPRGAALLVLPSALTWLAAGAAAELVLRTANPLVPGVPVLSIWALAVAIAVPADRWHLAGAVVVLAALLLLLYRRARRDLRVGPVSGLSTAAAAVAVAVVAAITTGGIGAHALDLRDHRQHTRLTVRHDVLADYFAWKAQPQDEVFVAERGGGGPWRLASLDRFDGQYWTTSAAFRRVGLEVPTAGVVPARDRLVSQTIRLTEPVTGSGAFLPHADRAVGIDGGLGLWVDPDAGTLYAAALAQGRYAVRSATAAALEPGVGPVPSGGRARPAHLEIPSACREVAAAVHGGAVTIGGQPLREVPPRLAAEVSRRLGDGSDPIPGDRRSLGCAPLSAAAARGQGTHEQRVVALVLAARDLGLPARLAVGFAAGAPMTAGRATAEDPWRVTGNDARLWAEVHLDALGWIPVHPASADGNAPPPPGGTEAQAPQASEGTPPGDGGGSTRVGSRVTTQFLLYGLLAVVAAVALTAAATRLGPVWRSARSRRRGSPSDRVAAAWRDAIAALARRGMSAPASATPSELLVLADHYTGRAVTQDLRRLTASHRLAWYARARMDEAQADEAWRRRDRVLQAVRRSRRPRFAARLHRTVIVGKR